MNDAALTSSKQLRLRQLLLITLSLPTAQYLLLTSIKSGVANADDTIPHLNYKNAGALKELAKFYRQTGPGTLVQVSSS